MMQQWQQMSNRDKAIAIGAVTVIVLVLGVFIWLLTIGRPSAPPVETEKAQVGGAPGAPTMPTGPLQIGTGPQPSPTAPGAPMVPGAPMAPQFGALPTGQPPTPGAPAPAPTAPQPGKKTKPPLPGRSDPFAALEPSVMPPTTVVMLPPVPAPRPVTVTGAVSYESLSAESLSELPGQQGLSVKSRSYFVQRPSVLEMQEKVMPQTVTHVSQEDPNWRLTGIMVSSDRVSAVLQLPNGSSKVVRSGDSVEANGSIYTVSRIEKNRAILKGPDGSERIVTRRPTQQVPTAQLSGVMPGVPYGPGAPFGPGGPSEGAGFGY